MKGSELVEGRAYFVSGRTGSPSIVDGTGFSTYTGCRAVVTKIGVPTMVRGDWGRRHESATKNGAEVMLPGGRVTVIPMAQIKMEWQEYEDYRARTLANNARLDAKQKVEEAEIKAVQDRLKELGVDSVNWYSAPISITSMDSVRRLGELLAKL